MKKLFIVLLNVILVLSLFSFTAGCSKADVDVKHDFTISHTKVTMEVGEELILIASCGDCEIEFVSDDAACATVSADGLIKAVSTGKANIIVSSQGSTSSRICVVEVIAPEYTVIIESETNFLAHVGANKTISAKTLRDGVEYKGEITFSAQDSSVVILQSDDNSATFRFNQAGEFEIVATDQFGNQSKAVITVIQNS